MKHFFSLLMVSLLLVLPVFADGDINIDGGGGGMGMGGVVGDSAWNPGDDGVRVSIMSGTTAVCTFDLSNVARTRTELCFKKHTKLYYKRGGALELEESAYTNIVAPADLSLPTIIPSGGGSNIEAIRSYFTDEGVVRFIADVAGMEYEELTGGSYKLLLEPVAYFKYNGVQWAMSATEAALWDVAVSRDLCYQMGDLTHQNQPLALYLERADLGISAWGGASSGWQANIDILNTLGCGVVSFFPETVTLEPPEGDYLYRTDTDVITSVLVDNETGYDWTPDAPAVVTFRIDGTTYRKEVICPEGSSQLVWVQWHTPDEPTELTIEVDAPGSWEAEIEAVVVALEENTPPNPIYDGPGPGPGITGTQYRPDFELLDEPDWGEKDSATWSQWVAEWQDLGPFLPGYWRWSVATYSARLRVDYELVPNDRVPTAVRRGSSYSMKSGYGVDAVCEVRVSAGGGVSNYDVTPVQNVVAVFPEFDFETYFRLLEPQRSGWYRTTWEFQENKYSYYNERVHFTPLWYPDEEFPVPVAVFDAWTPGGMLYVTASDSVEIEGDVYDDWYIRTY